MSSSMFKDFNDKPGAIDLLQVGMSHTFLLGAGASRAAFPNGDKNGRPLPLMKDLIDVVGHHDVLPGITGENFESVFSELSQDPKQSPLCTLIEDRVSDYFGSLELPDEPTLYDHLVLSLRPKDTIATFNWDPFLPRAIQRCSSIARVSQGLYLHGCVSLGACTRHQRASVNFLGAKCGQCSAELSPLRLLYPVTKKDYSSDPMISVFWKELKRRLTHSFMFTIFGYSAPQTDIEAIDLLKQGWGDPQSRQLEEIEIIDRPDADPEALAERWAPFIHTHHYQLASNFYSSYVSQFPRRSCDALFEALMQCNPQTERPLPCDANWKQLKEFLAPLIKSESQNEQRLPMKG